MLHEGQKHLENRGKDSHGGTFVSDGRLVSRRQHGVVPFYCKDSIFNGLVGSSGIGHNRYGTVGPGGDDYRQPLDERASFGDFSFAHNGTIYNSAALARRLFSEGKTFSTGRVLDESGNWTGKYNFDFISDSEVIGKLIAQKDDIVEGIRYASEQILGGYSLVLLTDRGDLYAVRDSRGLKPLCIGRNSQAVGVFSESCVFSSLDLMMEFERYVQPGEIFHAGRDGEETFELPDKEKVPYSLDIFEIVYFANSASVIDGIPVSLFREFGGMALGRKNPEDKNRGFVTVPVEFSGIDWAQGFARETGNPYTSWVRRQRYSGRAFISPDDATRQKEARQKLVLLESNIGRYPDGYLVDDSIVRGHTARKLINRLRLAGARQIHARIGFPPVIDICPWGGVDMKTPDEHIANQYRDLEERRKHLGLDSLIYNEPSDLIWAANEARNFARVNMPRYHFESNGALELSNFCTHCITRINPFGEQK